MRQELKLPILEKFEYENIPLDGNELRDKYPDVPFEDEDIKKYNYESYDRHGLITEEFLKQYKVEDLTVIMDFGNFKHITYLFGVKFDTSGYNGVRFKADKSFTLDKNGFEIKFDKSSGVTLRTNPNPKNNFEFYIQWGDSKVDFEINPDKSIADDYTSHFFDKLFEDMEEDAIIYKHPNGCQYYTNKHHIHKVLNIRVNEKKEDRKISIEIDKQNVVEPFKKYNDGYSVKRMPKKSKQISLEQMKLEFASICKHVINNKMDFVEPIYNASDIEHLFKGQNVKFKVKNGDNNYIREFIITDYVDKKGRSEQYIDSCAIYKKDKHIGSYDSFDKVEKEVRDGIMDFLVEKFGDDLELDLMDSDLDRFVYRLSLDTYENETYSGDYFYYKNNFDLGKCKVVINSSRYIKDGCICDLRADSIDIYQK